MKKLFLPLLLLLGIGFTSCEQEDVIDDIFCSHPWHLTDYYYTPDWNGAQSNPVPFDGEYYTDFDVHTITFLTDGSLIVDLPDGRATGRWVADGTTRQLLISSLKAPARLDAYSQKMINRLKGVAWYRGDIHVLALYDEDQHNFMQFETVK